MSKIALSMICLGLGEEPKSMARAIVSIIPYIDSVYVTLTGPEDQMKDAEEALKMIEDKFHKPVVISYERDKFFWTVTDKQIKWLKKFLEYKPASEVGDKIFKFDEARNFNLAQIPKEYEWFIWLDADDIFRGGPKLKEVAEKAEKDGLEAVYFNYIYQADIKDGKVNGVIIEHLRERLVRNNDAYKWVAPIHETLIEQRPTQKNDSPDCDVLHLSNDEERMKSLQRNLKALEYTIFKDEGKDPRPIYYYAKALYDLHKPETDVVSTRLMYMYLRGPNPSGWPEERAQAGHYLAELYRRNGKTQEAIVEAMNSLMEDISPIGFLSLATTYMVRGEWERALTYAKLAQDIEGKKTTLVINPQETTGKLLEILFNCHLNLHHVDEAYSAITQMVQMFPNDPNVINAYKFMESLKQERDVTKSVMMLADYLTKVGEIAKLKPLVAAIPEIARNNPFSQDLEKKTNPPKYWGGNAITIYCGPGFTNWTPKQLTDPQNSFVGGSEEAVIMMSKELAKLGYEVTVYADPGRDEGEYDGVNYLPYFKFNRLDHFNILIAWRQPEFFNQDLIAKKKYVWFHDIINSLQITKELIEKVDKFIVLSPWHRSNIPDVPDSKILVSSNGI
jgi:tetratricopeptide (TPR) repeat protein